MAVMHIVSLGRMAIQISIAATGSAGEFQSLTNSIAPHGSSKFCRGEVAI